MVVFFGISLGYLWSVIVAFWGKFQVGTTNIMIAVGIISMMYPPLAKVEYEGMNRIFRDRKAFLLSFVRNYVIRNKSFFNVLFNSVVVNSSRI